jgi:CheY-like chemotaxis protein
MKILIAEDDPVSAIVLRRTIERLGHEVIASDDGATAWEVVQGRQVPVRISDWMMGRGSRPGPLPGQSGRPQPGRRRPGRAEPAPAR